MKRLWISRNTLRSSGHILRPLVSKILGFYQPKDKPDEEELSHSREKATRILLFLEATEVVPNRCVSGPDFWLRTKVQPVMDAKANLTLDLCLGPSLSPPGWVMGVGQWPRNCSLQRPSCPNTFFCSSLVHDLSLSLPYNLQPWLRHLTIWCFITQTKGNISKNNLLDWRCLPAFLQDN